MVLCTRSCDPLFEMASWLRGELVPALVGWTNAVGPIPQTKTSYFLIAFLLTPIISVPRSGHYKNPGDGRTPFSFYPEQLAVELSFTLV